MGFSERYGYVHVRSVVQIEELDEESRRSIWNLVYLAMFNGKQYQQQQLFNQTFLPVWLHVFQRTADTYPGPYYTEEHVKTLVMEADWNRVYDLVEAMAGKVPMFTAAVNKVLENVNAGYRVLDGQAVPISDTAEVSEIEIAIGTEHEGTRHHLKQALDLLSDRDNPDYPNSIKESISAVESKTGQLTGKHTLGKALDEMKKSGPYVHPSLVEGWKKIYGWASDEDGLRHGGDSAPTPDQDLARYMLVTCSAFVNLLTAAEAKQSK
ncbi:hypothetical protein AC1659_19270 [Rhodococcus erythropolis]|uniref:AbiJ-NTD4 domain-containing protein n=1 Tax=Rhodococcus TaxID=1827 RepID=UPI00038E5035|nr:MULTISPECIES: hypothetical protein [Rhodococcus]EQM32373.1 hypothetical protein N601_17760 [Rhodococcus erythropolis DN1]MBS2991423.1 hypothetical protein [Rhodococcus erythropolis]NRH34195.1 hypothetical protein [Rhodococcus sp. MS13]